MTGIDPRGGGGMRPIPGGGGGGIGRKKTFSDDVRPTPLPWDQTESEKTKLLLRYFLGISSLGLYFHFPNLVLKAAPVEIL